MPINLARGRTWFRPINITERNCYGGLGVVFWGGIRLNEWTELNVLDKASITGDKYFKKCSQLASLDKNNALWDIKLRLSYLQGKSTTMSVVAHQTEKEWISANEKSRQRMSQTQAEGAAKQHAARLEEAHLRAHHSCFTTSERC
ncbi:hypothetical protein TNCV_4549981 [Trichonephila clavipes]|nr:hypothetical protein TNCV_4549981 [Trichonephila clavipes]